MLERLQCLLSLSVTALRIMPVADCASRRLANLHDVRRFGAAAGATP